MLHRWLVTEKVEREAWSILRRLPDQTFSFVDATSFALMAHHRARSALAFDSHFAAAGFVRLGVDGERR